MFIAEVVFFTNRSSEFGNKLTVLGFKRFKLYNKGRVKRCNKGWYSEVRILLV